MFGTEYLVKLTGLSGRQILILVSTAAVIGINVYRYVSHRMRVHAESEWCHIGKLTHLMCYPIKSCAAVNLLHSECSILGLKKGLLRDRTFMVVNHNGEFITGRSHPRLVQVIPNIVGPRLIMEAEGMPEVSVSIYDLYGLPTAKTSVWGQPVDTVDCGDQVAQWLTDFLLEGAQPGLRLVYYPSHKTSRDVRPKNKPFTHCTVRDVGALADATSYNLITKASIDDLNDRLHKPVTPEQFRPNFVVNTCQPYGEDEWEWIRIGNVVFQNIKPCTRYRKMNSLHLLPYTGDSPVFGIHLALLQPGHVHVGDEVYVKKMKRPTRPTRCINYQGIRYTMMTQPAQHAK